MLRRTRLASSLGVLMAAALSLSCEGSGGTGQLVATPTSPAPSTLEIVAERTEYLVGMVDRLPQVIDRSSEYPTNTWPEWGSMNPDIVEILPNGRFLARGPGSVDLIATSPYPDQQARITLEVTSPYERTGEPRLTAVEILGPPVIHDRLGAFEDAVVAYGIRHDQTLREVAATLSSADPDILTVDNDGTIHVTGAGETTISASYEGHSMTTPIVVLTWEQFNEPFPRIYGERQDIACSPVLWTPNGSTPTLLLEGVTVPLLVFEVCPDGAMRRIHDARLVSSDPEIVEVGPGGLVTARRSGRAALRYEPPAASAPGGAAAITVLPAFNVTAETLGRRVVPGSSRRLRGTPRFIWSTRSPRTYRTGAWIFPERSRTRSRSCAALDPAGHRLPAQPGHLRRTAGCQLRPPSDSPLRNSGFVCRPCWMGWTWLWTSSRTRNTSCSHRG